MVSLKLFAQWQSLWYQKNTMPQKEYILAIQITLNIKMFSEKQKWKLWAITVRRQHKPTLLADPELLMRFMLSMWTAGATETVHAWAWPWHHLNMNDKNELPQEQGLILEKWLFVCTRGCWSLTIPLSELFWLFLTRWVTVAHLFKEWLKNKTQQNRQTFWHSSKGKGWSFLFFGWIPLWDASPCFSLASGQALLCEGTWICRGLQCTLSSVCFKGKFQKSLFSGNFKHLNGAVLCKAVLALQTVLADFDDLEQFSICSIRTDTKCGLCSLADKSVGFAVWM